MVPQGEDRPSGLTINPDFAEASAVGKRFADEESGLEVLVTKAGDGSLSDRRRRPTHEGRQAAAVVGLNRSGVVRPGPVGGR